MTKDSRQNCHVTASIVTRSEVRVLECFQDISSHLDHVLLLLAVFGEPPRFPGFFDDLTHPIWSLGADELYEDKHYSRDSGFDKAFKTNGTYSVEELPIRESAVLHCWQERLNIR